MKISELPAAGPTDGTEEIPIVQHGSTEQISVSQLLAPVYTALASNAANAGAGLVGFLSTSAYTAGSVGALLKNLLSSAGSTLIGFLQSGTGAVARTVFAKLAERVSVSDFGAVGDGVADDTAAIRAALNSRAGRIELPPGTYLVTQTLDFAFAGQRLVGGGVSSTCIVFQTGAATGLRCNGLNACGVYGAKLKGSGNTGGELLLVQNCSGFIGQGIRVETGFNGINFVSINNATLADFVVADHTGAFGVRFAGTSATRADVLKLHGGEISHASNPNITSILWESYAQSLTLLDVRVINGGKGLRIWDSSGDGTSNSIPAFLEANILEFDFTNGESIRADNLRDAWLANLYGHGATASNGVHFGADAWSIRLVSGRITSASQHGLYIAGRFVQVVNTRCYDNGQSASNSYDGICVESTASEVTVIGCASGWSNTFGTQQRWGLNIIAGASNVRYLGNDFSGNISGEITGSMDIANRVGSNSRHAFYNGNGKHVEIGGSTAGVVNNFRFAGSAAGGQLQVLAEGTDTNIDIKLAPKGSGRVQFANSRVANADAPITGYLEVKDNSGTVYKLAIIG